MLPGRNLAIMFALIFIFAQFAKGGMNKVMILYFTAASIFFYAVLSGRITNAGIFDLSNLTLSTYFYLSVQIFKIEAAMVWG